MSSTKTRTAAEAAALVPDGATVLVTGSGGGINEPGAVLDALEQRFLAENHPRDLTAVHVAGMGNGHGAGIDRLAHEGMVRRVVGGHWSWCKEMQRFALEEKIEAYCLPQGVLSHLLREIAGGRPGVISRIGLGTTIDPRHEGGRLNATTREDLVHVVELGGQEYLFTPSFPIDVAIVRGTRADVHGNLTMDEEGIFAETLAAAQAAKNSGGIVLAQVRELVEAGTLDPRTVRVPGVLVDAVVVEPTQRLSVATRDDSFLTGRARAVVAEHEPLPLGVRKVIARRAAMEVRRGDVVNLGFGMGDGVAAVLAEEGQAQQVTLTVDQGHVGGVPVGGSDFGLVVNPEASLDAGQQFDWYDGGGLDLAVLSFAQLDRHGNVNVGRFSGRIPGVGGFINISQGTRRLVLVGTLVVGGSYDVGGDVAIRVPADGGHKLIEDVEQISFSASRALETGQEVLYVTERAVLRLTDRGLELVEVAPGLDLERDVLAHMDFRPVVAAPLQTMDERLFRPEPMGLVLPNRVP